MSNIRIVEYNNSSLYDIKGFLLRGINYIPKIESPQNILLLVDNEIIIGIGSV